MLGNSTPLADSLMKPLVSWTLVYQLMLSSKYMVYWVCVCWAFLTKDMCFINENFILFFSKFFLKKLHRRTIDEAIHLVCRVTLLELIITRSRIPVVLSLCYRIFNKDFFFIEKIQYIKSSQKPLLYSQGKLHSVQLDKKS